MANISHRVGILFHAQDRLTGTLEKYSAKLGGLGAKEKALSQAARERAGMEEKLNALREKGAVVANRQANQQRANDRAEIRLTKEKFAINERYFAKQVAAKKTLAGIDARTRAEQRTLETQHNAQMLAQDKTFADRRIALARETGAALRAQAAETAALSRELSSLSTGDSAYARNMSANTKTRNGLSRHRDNLELRANSLGMQSLGIMSPQLSYMRSGLLDQKQEFVSSLLSSDQTRHDMLSNLRSTRTYIDAPAEGQAQMESSVLSDHAGRISGINNEITRLDKKLKLLTDIELLEEKELANGAELGAINVAANDRTAKKLALQQRVEASLVEESAIRARAAAEEVAILERRAVANNELHIAQAAAMTAKREGDAKEYAFAKKVYDAKLAQIQTLKATELRGHELSVEALSAQRAVTAGLVTEHTALVARMETELGLQVAITRAAEKAVLLTKQRAAMMASGAGMIRSGAGTVMSSAIGLGTLGYAAHHLATSAADIERQKTELRGALRNEPGAAEALIGRVARNDSRIPGGLRVSSGAQLHMLKDMIGAGMQAKEAGESLNTTAELIALNKVRNPKQNTDNMAVQLGTIYEKFGLNTAAKVTAFNSSFAKGAMVSNRLNLTSMLNMANKFAPIGRTMKLDLTDTSSYDFLLGLDPTGNRVGTQAANLLSGWARGGTNAETRAMMKAAIDGGFIKRSTRSGPMMMGKKPVIMENGKPVMLNATPDLSGLSIVGAITAVRDGILRSQGIDPKKFDAGKLSKAELAKVMQVQSKMSNAKTGDMLLKPFFDNTQTSRAKLDRERQKHAPDMFQQLATYGKQYGLKSENFLQVLKQLGAEVGTKIIPEMNKMIDQFTSLADWVRKLNKDNPELVSNLFSLLKNIGLATLAAGTATASFGLLKFTLGGLNLIALGLPSVIAKQVYAAAASSAVTGAWGMGASYGIATALRSAAVTTAWTVGIAAVGGLVGYAIGEVVKVACDKIVGREGAANDGLYNFGYHMADSAITGTPVGSVRGYRPPTGVHDQRIEIHIKAPGVHSDLVRAVAKETAKVAGRAVVNVTPRTRPTGHQTVQQH